MNEVRTLPMWSGNTPAVRKNMCSAHVFPTAETETKTVTVNLSLLANNKDLENNSPAGLHK